MKLEPRMLDIGRMEYTVGPAGASNAVAISAAVVVSVLDVQIYIISHWKQS